jgi:hypothetical protein
MVYCLWLVIYSVKLIYIDPDNLLLYVFLLFHKQIDITCTVSFDTKYCLLDLH